MPISTYYDAEAELYARKFARELDNKPYDRYILDRFSSLIPDKGTVCEIGCGPGQVSCYLKIRNSINYGLDLSLQMLQESFKLKPFNLPINGNYFHLPFKNHSLDGILGFYAIVHDETFQVELLLSEVNRVLKPCGIFVFSFHVGNNRITATNTESTIEYIFHDFEKINDIVNHSHFTILESVVRLPYSDVEYPSRRAYFLLRKQ
jgi:SAM-dependent methyltransferase